MGYASGGAATPEVVFEWEYYGEAQAIQGTWSNKPNAGNWLYNARSNDNTKALDDEVALQSFFIAEAGDYTLHMTIATDSSHGIIHVLINGVDVAQIDGYSGSIIYNVLNEVSVGALTVGNKVLRLQMHTKNGSASNYGSIIQNITIVKAV